MKKALVLISLIILLLSFTQIPVHIENPSNDTQPNSLLLFFFGWTGILFIGDASTFPWLANPLLIISWYFIFKKQKIAIITSVVAFTISLSFLCINKIATSEAPSYSKIVEYGMGYWFWLTSAGIFAAGNLILFFLENQNNSK